MGAVIPRLAAVAVAVQAAAGCYSSGPEDRCPYAECEQIPVPVGPFMMGSDDDDPRLEMLSPPFQVDLSAFRIDRYEVTVRRFRLCVEAGACRWEDDGWCDMLGSGGEPPRERDRTPVDCVSPVEAEAYCRWIGRRLPTEAEWEKAARGGCEIVEPASCGPEDTTRRYSWTSSVDVSSEMCSLPRVGDSGTFGPGMACCTRHGPELGVVDLFDVGSDPPDRSPYGVQDMAGNVSEITSDAIVVDLAAACGTPCVDPHWESHVGMPSSIPPGARIVRGGDICSGRDDARVYFRSRISSGPGPAVGFRCASDAE